MYALTRLVEIIGEAATRVSPEFRNQYTDVRWRAAIGMRNRLIHAYDQVDLEILWETVTDHLPQLIASLELIIGQSDAP